MTTSTSTIVETININYEDFNESFLTCATCLYPFDTDHHRPKLLSCSHTVCKTCLERIAELPQSQDTGSFRCPICRETIPVPRTGVQSLPPSFVINQLIDLMSRQRRDLVPKCATHADEELLFCETCDVVFCASCSASSSTTTTLASLENQPSQTSSPSRRVSQQQPHQASQCLNHTVVPFSIAIKRMSEILLYKANQCTKNLNRAAENVRQEMETLDNNADRVVDQVNTSFQELNKCVERRRQELIDMVRRTRDSKRKILQEQLGIIHSEKAKVEQECSGLHTQLLDVRHISRRVNELNQKLDASGHLIEPRENCFLRYDADSSGLVMDGLRRVLSEFGSLCISKTFPPLCMIATATPPMLNVQCTLLLTTIDYEGQNRLSGGDPVRVQMYSEEPNLDPVLLVVPATVKDKSDGTYEVLFTPTRAGQHFCELRIFDRPVSGSPMRLIVDAHNDPLCILGGSACTPSSTATEFNQPVKCVVSHCETPTPRRLLLVLDTGNNRVKIFEEAATDKSEYSNQFDYRPVRSIVGEPLAFQSTVGLTLTPQRTFLTLNWRTKCVTEWSLDVATAEPTGPNQTSDTSAAELKSFTFSEFVEPLDLAVDSEGRVLVADNGAKKVFVFDHAARPQFSFVVKSTAELSATSINSSNSSTVTSLVSAGTMRRRRGSGDKLGGSNPNSTTASSLTLGSTGKSSQAPPVPSNYRHSTVGFPLVQLTCIAVGPHDDIIVGGSEVQIYDHCGRYVCNVLPPGLGVGASLKPPPSFFVGGLSVDTDGHVLATVTDMRGQAYLAVCRYGAGAKNTAAPNCYTVDSHGAKLKRPGGIGCDGTTPFCYVADLGNNCIKKYRYK